MTSACRYLSPPKDTSADALSAKRMGLDAPSRLTVSACIGEASADCASAGASRLTTPSGERPGRRTAKLSLVGE